MSDPKTLPERLRDGSYDLDDLARDYSDIAAARLLMREAADRITQLEAALTDLEMRFSLARGGAAADATLGVPMFLQRARALLHPDPSQGTKETA